MAWLHRNRERERERLRRTPDGKLAPAPTAEQQKAKLAELDDFKVAPLATNNNLPVPVDPKTGKPKPDQQASAPTHAPVPPASAPAFKPKPAPQATPTSSAGKPAFAPKPKKKFWGSLLDWGKSVEEDLAADLKADLEQKPGVAAQPAPKKYYEQQSQAKEKPKQETAEADKFKPAPIAMSTNLPAPASKPTSSSSTQTGIVPGLFKAVKKQEKSDDDLKKDLEEELKKKLKRENEVKAAQEAEVAKAKETKKAQETKVAEKFKPAPIFMATPTNLPAPAGQQSNKPATKAVAPVASPRVSTETGLTPQEVAALKAREARLESEVDQSRRAFKSRFASVADAEEAVKAWPAYIKKQVALIDQMIDAAEQRKASQDATNYRRKLIDIRREEPEKPKIVDTTKLPQHQKPTFEQFQANPSRYGGLSKAKAPRSSYKPTAADLAAQPWRPAEPACNNLGRYKAAENCKTCRSMADWVHCPCNCGHHVPIDRGYNPMGGEASPSFKGGRPGSTRPWG